MAQERETEIDNDFDGDGDDKKGRGGKRGGFTRKKVCRFCADKAVKNRPSPNKYASRTKSPVNDTGDCPGERQGNNQARLDRGGEEHLRRRGQFGNAEDRDCESSELRAASFW